VLRVFRVINNDLKIFKPVQGGDDGEEWVLENALGLKEATGEIRDVSRGLWRLPWRPLGRPARRCARWQGCPAPGVPDLASAAAGFEILGPFSE
jgi:hypothetical protein